jgi:hypothetical protein
MTMTEHDYDLAMEEWLRAARAVFRGLKNQDPQAHPWIGNMLGTEHLRTIATGLVIQVTRRGDWAPPARDSAPAALTPATTTKAQREASTASGGPARGDPVDTTAERETFVCAKYKKVKYWEPRGSAKGKAPWPGATCFECYKAGKAVKA